MVRLQNKKFRMMFRVIDMLCINFGKTVSTEEIRIADQLIHRRTIPEFSLHLQTHWRFRDGDTILLGSRDIYHPFSKGIDEDCWDYAETNRPDCESSIFDVVSKQVSAALKKQYVTSSTMTAYGDIRIDFSNGYVFEAFVPDSAKQEEWRLIDHNADEHFIFCDSEEE